LRYIPFIIITKFDLSTSEQILRSLNYHKLKKNSLKYPFFLYKRAFLYIFIVMPPTRQPKQHRSAISDDLKRQICEWSEANKNKKHHEIAEHFNKKYPNVTID
jgi:hypothetical protein